MFVYYLDIANSFSKASSDFPLVSGNIFKKIKKPTSAALRIVRIFVLSCKLSFWMSFLIPILKFPARGRLISLCRFSGLASLLSISSEGK